MEKQNKFKIVIPSYNNEEWYEYNLASILNQTYTNYEVLYINDKSTDSTYQKVQDIVGQLGNWKVVTNEENMRRGYNLSPYNPLIVDFMTDDEDILLFVDGDDWLFDDDVLDNLNKLYNEKDYWMTYGMFVCYPNGEVGNPQNTPYPDYVHRQNAYRQDMWRASHLRTFKWHLYKQIKKEDLVYTKTGEFYFHAEDLATSFPCLEMCPVGKIGVVPFPTYVYNVSETNRDRVVNDASREPGGYQYEVAVRESEIRNRTPYKTLYRDYSVTSCLAGGLGNMMFQVAAAYAVSRDYGYNLLLDPSHTGTLHRAPIEYSNTIFRNINILQEIVNTELVLEKEFHYSPLQIPNYNTQLSGYFQSYKYFNNYAQEVRQLFSPSPEVVAELLSKYPILNQQTVSLHVRRGNYTALADHHHNLSVEYYLNAIDYFKGYKFLIFSDDIAWCKNTFIGDHFEFVEGNDDVTDMYLMSLCKHNVIANSTFSWWGAWLNGHTDKVVVYPDKWFGPANSSLQTADLFPDEWICLTEQVPQVTINMYDNSIVHLVKPNGRYSSVHDKISAKVKFENNKNPYNGITLFTDAYLGSDYVKQVGSKYKIGWLLETREVDPSRYVNFEHYKDNFDFVMTHDAELLEKYPSKTKFTIFGGTWIKNKNYGLHNKNKNVSMIYSGKQSLTGHKMRHTVATTVSGVDLFGHGSPKPIKYKEEALLDYRFSIIIENSKTPNYFTEKLLDCLITGTVPIYWGCPNVGEFFDTNGMIIVDGPQDIKEVVASLSEKEYIDRIAHIKNNIELAKKYAITEDWMYDNVFSQLT